MSAVVHVLGTRPNFPKAAPVVAALRRRGVEQMLVHTGQHYDDRLSRVFFDELGLPEPDVHLKVGSGTHAVQTGAVMAGLEELFLERPPALAMLYGDVNSTLAGALVAAKLRVPAAHVEAGLRSFDDSMPEEVNRRVTDQLCDLLFATSPEAVGHLAREGRPVGSIHLVGNPMIDTLLAHLPAVDAEAARRRHAPAGPYLVATLHRPGNVDDPYAVRHLAGVLRAASERLPLVMPLHPRGRAALGAALHPTRLGADVVVTEPLPYTEFLGLVRGARAVITDSGGVQEETTVLGVPCLTVRPNTERPITVTHGTNRLVTVDGVLPALEEILTRPLAAGPSVSSPLGPPPLWDGAAGERIAAVVCGWLGSRTGDHVAGVPVTGAPMAGVPAAGVPVTVR